MSVISLSLVVTLFPYVNPTLVSRGWGIVSSLQYCLKSPKNVSDTRMLLSHFSYDFFSKGSLIWAFFVLSQTLEQDLSWKLAFLLLKDDLKMQENQGVTTLTLLSEISRKILIQWQLIFSTTPASIFDERFRT